MKDTFAADFEKVLTRMKWPGKDVPLAGSLEHEWTDGVERLLELQKPYVLPPVSNVLMTWGLPETDDRAFKPC